MSLQINAHAPATTGPAQAPRPASSTPIIRRDFFIILSEFCHTLSYNIRDILVERVGDDHVFGRISDVGCECLSSTEFHFFGDHTESILEGSFEDSWEYEDIVELIREVRATGRDDASTTRSGFIWHDLRCRIRHRENHRILVHGGDIRSRDRICNTDPYEYIRSSKGILESSGEIIQIGYLEDFHLRAVEIGSVF